MHKYQKHILIGFIIVLAIAMGLSNFASNLPDGLEYVSVKHQFVNTAQEIYTLAPFKDYECKLVSNNLYSSYITGFIGVMLSFVGSFCVLKLFATQKKSA